MVYPPAPPVSDVRRRCFLKLLAEATESSDIFRPSVGMADALFLAAVAVCGGGMLLMVGAEGIFFFCSAPLAARGCAGGLAGLAISGSTFLMDVRIVLPPLIVRAASSPLIDFRMWVAGCSAAVGSKGARRLCLIAGAFG